MKVIQTPQADNLGDEVIIAAGYHHVGDRFNIELFPDNTFGVSMVRESLTEACIKVGTSEFWALLAHNMFYSQIHQ